MRAIRLFEAIRNVKNGDHMEIVLRNGRHLACQFDTLLYEEYYSFCVRIESGSSPEFEPGTLLEVLEKSVAEVNGIKITHCPRGRG